MPTTSLNSDNVDKNRVKSNQPIPQDPTEESCEFKGFLADIEDLVKATNLLAGDELAKAKSDITKRIDTVKKSMVGVGNGVAQRARKAATCTNDYAHSQPW